MSSTPDIYDAFVNIIVSSRPKIRSIVLETIRKHITHPAYLHLMHTLDNTNARYIAGYLRTTPYKELNEVIKQIVALYN
jgi:hypothetical protein